MPHPEREHELQVAIATALRERDEARLALANAITARDEEMNESDARADAAEEALAAARLECEGLRKALSNACAALTLAGAELARRLNERREKMSTTEAVNDEVAEAVVRAARDASAAFAAPAAGEEGAR